MCIRDRVSNAEEVIQTPTAPVDSDVSEEPVPAEADAQVDRIGDSDEMTLDFDPAPAMTEMAAATEAPELSEETHSGDVPELANTIEFSLDDGLPVDDDDAIAESSDSTGADASDVEGKLDLARAYVEIGDKAAAIELLDEIDQQGTSVQKEVADVLRKELLG